MTTAHVHENIWAEKYKYEEAEKQYFERLAKLSTPAPTFACPVAAAALDKMSEAAPEIPASCPSDNVVVAEQDKKKKRRKRNNGSNSGATVSGNASSIQETAPAKPEDKKVKEKKNEASKKGKKPSPEPMQPLATAKGANPTTTVATGESADTCSLASEVAKARQHIKTSLECVDRISTFAHSSGGADFVNRILTLEKENEGLRKLVEKMQKSQDAFEARLKQLEQKCSSVTSPVKPTQQPTKTTPAKPTPAKDDDDDVDLFGSESEEEDEASKQVREKRLAEYAAKKSKKPALIAKSNVILDVKPWDDETDMKQLEQAVRDISMDGLLWGASKLVPLAYGIHKLQISCVVEDEKVSIDLLTESIEEKSDFVQSVDIAAFNKI